MLSARIDVYIPVNIDNAEMVTLKVCESMIDRFGGVTTINASGFYRSHNGAIVRDEITIVYAYANVLEWTLYELQAIARTHAHYVIDSLDQESVLITVNNVAYLVESEL